MVETVLNLLQRLLKIVKLNLEVPYPVRDSFWFVLLPFSRVFRSAVAKAP